MREIALERAAFRRYYVSITCPFLARFRSVTLLSRWIPRDTLHLATRFLYSHLVGVNTLAMSVSARNDDIRYSATNGSN